MVITSFLIFAVSAILSFSSFIVYRKTCQKLSQTAVQESQQIISQSAENIRSAFGYTLTVFSGNFLRKELNNILSNQTGRTVHGTLLSIHNELKNRFYTNNYIQDIALFIEDETTDYWCSVKLISDDFKSDYDNGLFRFDTLSYSEFREMITTSIDTKNVHRNYFTGHVTSRYSDSYSANIAYMPCPIRLTGSSLNIYAVLQINLDNLSREMLSSQYCSSYINLCDLNGEIYTTDRTIEPPDGKNSFPYYEKNTDTWYIRDFIDELGLTCHIALDTQKIYENIAPFSNLLFGFFVIMSLTLCIFIYFLFRYWFVPIFRIAGSIPDNQAGSQNVVEKINDHLTVLATQNIATISKLRDYQNNALFKSMYTGQRLSSADLTVIHQILPIQENNFRCICIGRLNTDYEQLPDTVQLLSSLEMFHISATAGLLIDGIFACLVIQPEDAVYKESSVFFDALNKFLSTLNQDNYLYAIGVSDVYNGFGSIPTAYQEALNSWNSAMVWQNAAVVFNTALSKYANSYHVSYMQLDSMYQAIVSNHKNNVLNIFDQLVFDNFGDMKNIRIRALYYQQFENDILGVLIRISTQYDIYAIIEAYLSKNAKLPLSEQILLLRNTIVESSEFIPIHNYDHDMATTIHEYCVKHYCDYQLSLTTLSEQFHLSKSSLSKFFKAHFGMNFITYIERMRISRAETLLMEKKLTVREIAEEIGYQNITTFYNVFRKVKKCTPTEWREQQMVISKASASE